MASSFRSLTQEEPSFHVIYGPTDAFIDSTGTSRVSTNARKNATNAACLPKLRTTFKNAMGATLLARLMELPLSGYAFCSLYRKARVDNTATTHTWDT